MKTLLHLLFLIFLIPISSGAQNLVPNPSFEDHVACPTALGQLPYVSGAAISVSNWTKPTNASSDYLHVCYNSFNTLGTVPLNYAGYQVPRTGDAYAGIYCKSFSANDYKEYIQAHLTSPLITGHRYRVNYWISLADWTTNATAVIAVDQMGAYFGVLPEERPVFFWVMSDLTPQVKSPTGLILSDTIGWMNVSGIYTAAGNEEWMILGNFTPQDSINYIYYGGDSLSGQSYYYVDDVCLLDLDGSPGAYQVHDTAMCSASSIVLTASAAGAEQYSWDDGSTGQSRTVTQTGLYWVTYSFEGDCTLHADSFRVNEIDTVPINIGADTVVCDNIPISLNAAQAWATQYLWNTGETQPTLVVNQPGTYYVKASSPCRVGMDTINLFAPATPEAKLPGDTILCNGMTLTLTHQQQDISNLWSNGSAACCIDIKETGTYSLTTTNVCGTTATDDIEVSFTACNNCVFIPTAFSPNGDGVNDEYTIRSICDMKSYSLKIFDRWGRAVFISSKPGESWNGKVHGKMAETGVYFYYLKAQPSMPGTEAIEAKGDVTLLK